MIIMACLHQCFNRAA